MPIVINLKRLLSGRAIVLFLLLSVVAISVAGSEPPQIECILTQVDETILESSVYEQKKLGDIQALKHRLAETLPYSKERYEINRLLFAEYESLVCDSALRYLNDNIELARHLGRQDLTSSSLIFKAMVISKAGLFNEAIDILKGIDTSNLDLSGRINYYKSWNELYQFLIEYEGDGDYSVHYRELSNAYKDSVLALVEPGSFDDVSIRGSRLMDDEQFEDGTRLLKSRLHEYRRGTREYSILASILAYGYLKQGNHDEMIRYYAESAMSDIEGVVKENMAMRALAEAVFSDGELERANRYIQKSIDDANYYSARMRKNQSALMLPIMSRSFQATQSESQRQLTLFLIITAVLAIGLIISCCFIIRQLKTVKASHRIVLRSKDELEQLNNDLVQTNKAFERANRELSEANCIKEEYIGRFLELCSNYISTLEQYRKMLFQQAASGRIEELHRSLKSQKFVNETLADFYSSFDSAFLNIFPDFVARINSLLPEGGKIQLKGEEKLNTELRIFALIRLGISDSAKIANFLRCSITTIYTYRSKVKNRSSFKGDFEKEVMKISSF